MTFEFLRKPLQDEIASRLFDILRNHCYRFIFRGCGCHYLLALDSRSEFVGIVLDRKETHCRACLVQRPLGELCSWKITQPFHGTSMKEPFLCSSNVLVGAINLPNMDLSIHFRWIDYEVSVLHFTNEPE